jgi:hypothetical protein
MEVRHILKVFYLMKVIHPESVSMKVIHPESVSMKVIHPESVSMKVIYPKSVLSISYAITI